MIRWLSQRQGQGGLLCLRQELCLSQITKAECTLGISWEWLHNCRATHTPLLTHKLCSMMHVRTELGCAVLGESMVVWAIYSLPMLLLGTFSACPDENDRRKLLLQRHPRRISNRGELEVSVLEKLGWLHLPNPTLIRVLGTVF